MPIPEPSWLRNMRAKPVKTKRNKDTIRYYENLYRAEPAWLSKEDQRAISAIYLTAKATGKSVDHIVPLRSPLVCGLHVPWNLQVISREENMQKSNTFWPDAPFEQTRLAI